MIEELSRTTISLYGIQLIASGALASARLHGEVNEVARQHAFTGDRGFAQQFQLKFRLTYTKEDISHALLNTHYFK